MKNLLKIVIALMLSLCLVFTFAACGGDKNDVEPGDDNVAENNDNNQSNNNNNDNRSNYRKRFYRLGSF